MEVIYYELISQVENKTCAIHNQHPQVKFVGKRLNLSCCCDDFKVCCYMEIIAILKAYKEGRNGGGFLRKVV
jgi:hypothetical protein